MTKFRLHLLSKCTGISAEKKESLNCEITRLSIKKDELPRTSASIFLSGSIKKEGGYEEEEEEDSGGDNEINGVP